MWDANTSFPYQLIGLEPESQCQARRPSGSQIYIARYGTQVNYAEMGECMVPIIGTHVLHPFSSALDTEYEEGLSGFFSLSIKPIWIPFGTEALKI